MTSIETERRAVPASEGEREQMEAAFRAALEQLPANTGVTYVVRQLARALFEVGWVWGVRSGHTGPALADVPLPSHTFGTALSSLAVALDDEKGPCIGQESVRYRLSDYTRGKLRTALSGVHAESVTALPQHFQMP
ncbi:hypothetical protein [Streptomyces sp. NPDC001635]